jgi:hypothetical protein
MIRRAVLIMDDKGKTLIYSPDAAITIDMEKITICIRHDEISSPVGRYEVEAEPVEDWMKLDGNAGRKLDERGS